MTGTCSRKVTGDSHLFVQLFIGGGQRSLSRLQLAGSGVVAATRLEVEKRPSAMAAGLKPLSSQRCSFSAPRSDQSPIEVPERNRMDKLGCS